jgi:hypothetical protein
MPNNFFPAPPAPPPLSVGVTGIGPQPFAWQQTVMSQYANADRTMNLIASFSDAFDQTANIDRFYDLVWNVDTAQGWGLDVWGRIVVIGRALKVPVKYFGFDEMGPDDIEPFNSAPYYSGQALTSTFLMSDDVYRKAILAKALANICEGTIPAINKVLQLLFPGRGNCYVTDPADMTMQYVFEFPTSAAERAIVTQTGIFQHPAGVTTTFDFA